MPSHQRIPNARGAALVEFAMTVGLVVLVAAVGAKAIGTKVSSSLTKVHKEALLSRPAGNRGPPAHGGPR